MIKHAITLGRFAALSIALVLALTVTVAILAVNHDRVTGAGPATQPRAEHAANRSADTMQEIPASQSPSARFDGGPEEGTRGTATSPTSSTRFDGGPDKSTRGTATSPTSSTRFDGGPEEGSRGSRR